MLLLNSNFLIMDSAKTLYSILNLIIFLIIFSIGIGLIMTVLILFNVIDGPLALKPDFVDYKNDIMQYVFMAFKLIVYIVFISGLLKLRFATKLLLEKDFYKFELIKALGFAGKAIVITGILSWLIDGLSHIYFNDEISISISEKTFVYLFVTAMGLFLMLMGNVINDAKNLKQENDLTI